MSDNTLAQAAATGDKTILPNYWLRPLRIFHYAELQARFEANYLAVCAKSCEQLNEASAKRVLDHAAALISSGMFRYPLAAFDAAIESLINFPLLLSQCLGEKHPEADEKAAKLLIESHPNMYALQRACLVQAGYVFRPKESASQTMNAPPPTGELPTKSLSGAGEAGNTSVT